MLYVGRQRGDFQKLSSGSETLHVTSVEFGEMFEGNFADKWTKILLMSMGAKLLCQACADTGSKTFIPENLN